MAADGGNLKRTLNVKEWLLPKYHLATILKMVQLRIFCATLKHVDLIHLIHRLDCNGIYDFNKSFGDFKVP